MGPGRAQSLFRGWSPIRNPLGDSHGDTELPLGQGPGRRVGSAPLMCRVGVFPQFPNSLLPLASRPGFGTPSKVSFSAGLGFVGRSAQRQINIWFSLSSLSWIVPEAGAVAPPGQEGEAVAVTVAAARLRGLGWSCTPNVPAQHLGVPSLPSPGNLG